MPIFICKHDAFSVGVVQTTLGYHITGLIENLPLALLTLLVLLLEIFGYLK